MLTAHERMATESPSARRWRKVGERFLLWAVISFGLFLFYFVAVQFGLPEFDVVVWPLIIAPMVLLLSGMFCLNRWLWRTRGQR